MRMSRLFTTTLREVPHDIDSISQELLVRGGFIRQLTSGVYSFLPLGTRVISKISAIVREEMDRVGGQEVILPILQPKDIWDIAPANGGPSRYETVDVLFKLQDRRGRDMLLGPTHEEVVTTLAAEFIRSYRDLPRLIYQIQTKFRDEPRPRGALLRVREFIMKDLYSFDADFDGLDASYRTMSQAYQRIFKRCGVEFVVIHADSGAIGGKASQEFIAVTGAGEDDAMICDSCGYAANREKAEFVRPELANEPEGSLEDVYTPNCSSIDDLTAFLNIPAAKTIKSVCYGAGSRLILAVVRGDLEINEIKLSNTLYSQEINAAALHVATPEELGQHGIVAGYTSPMGKDSSVLIIADTSLQSGNNFVTGANRANFHIKNANYPRDFRVDVWEDIAQAFDGAICTHCGGTLHPVRGCEIGHIFKPGTMYSERLGATFLDADGIVRPIMMGSYGIGIGRIMAVVVEQSHDEKGIIWPFSIAPYHVALLGLDLDKPEIRQVAEQLYTDLTAAGVEVLFDDRAETAGVKFNDADLLGLPLRVVVSKRALKNGGLEFKLRSQKESRIVTIEDAVLIIQREIQGTA
jgi:prolyl-tRNA synthetase